MYYNYHKKAQQNIIEGNLERYEIVEKWNDISPAMILYFKNSKPVPIRKEKWEEYYFLIEKYLEHKVY